MFTYLLNETTSMSNVPNTTIILDKTLHNLLLNIYIYPWRILTIHGPTFNENLLTNLDNKYDHLYNE